jgi:hypothetical protein
MTLRYRYKMSGTAAYGQTWETTGTVEIEPASFPDVALLATRDTFIQLTKGKAVFGSPGLRCAGPYRIKKLTVELEE